MTEQGCTKWGLIQLWQCFPFLLTLTSKNGPNIISSTLEAFPLLASLKEGLSALYDISDLEVERCWGRRNIKWLIVMCWHVWDGSDFEDFWVSICHFEWEDLLMEMQMCLLLQFFELIVCHLCYFHEVVKKEENPSNRPYLSDLSWGQTIFFVCLTNADSGEWEWGFISYIIVILFAFSNRETM